MSRDCPYCGASFVEGWSGRIFKCGTDIGRHHGDFRHEDCYKNQINQQVGKIATLNLELGDLKMQYLALGGENERLRQALKKLEDESADYLTQCATLKAENCNLAEKVTSLQGVQHHLESILSHADKSDIDEDVVRDARAFLKGIPHA